ncbi:MAG: hypothetical protein IKD07_00600 [Clostridia bacterium]|nr:hypothetical protein [Clostridia bacterium]
MKKTSNILWGIIIVALGVLFAMKAFGVDVDIFFDGWWTLFIIVPFAVGLFTEREKLGNLIGVGIGVLLLLACRDVIPFSLIWKLAIPAILILIGLKMIFGGIFDKKANAVSQKMKSEGKASKNGTSVFSDTRVDFVGQDFYGAELNSIFGGLTCDLNGALIREDCVINACAVFGGIDILVPEGVNVRLNSNSVFGGASDKKKRPVCENAPTVYVNATCMFGGLDIK